jgi:PilZ domain
MGSRTTTQQAEKQALQLDPGRRRSMRVLLSVPIHVTGKSREGAEFDEETRTLVVNAHGALISLGAKVAAGQQIVVSNRSTNKSLDCRVVYLGNPSAGKIQMGVEFVDVCPQFWQIDFPPDDWVMPEN